MIQKTSAPGSAEPQLRKCLSELLERQSGWGSAVPGEKDQLSSRFGLSRAHLWTWGLQNVNTPVCLQLNVSRLPKFAIMKLTSLNSGTLERLTPTEGPAIVGRTNVIHNCDGL